MQCGMDVYGNNTGTNMTLKENITSFLWGPPVCWEGQRQGNHVAGQALKPLRILFHSKSSEISPQGCFYGTFAPLQRFLFSHFCN